MFFLINEEQIQQFKNAQFPPTSSFGFQNIKINNSGTDNIIDFSFFINEQLRSSRFGRIIQSQPTQIIEYFTDPVDTVKRSKFFSQKQNNINILKIKIFEINSNFMKNEILSVKTIPQIQKIIALNGCESVDLYAATDFTGPKDAKSLSSGILATERETTVGVSDPQYKQYAVDLRFNYKNKLILKREEVGFLSIGVVFYIDFKEYLAQTNLPEKFVNQQMLLGDVKIADILDSNGKLISRTATNLTTGQVTEQSIIQDLRTMKKIFKNKQTLEKIYEKTFFGAKNIRTAAILKNETQTQDVASFFSTLYGSRDELGNLNLLFTFNKNQFISFNNQFRYLYKGQQYPQYTYNEIINKSEISSIKIIRREFDYNPLTKKRPNLRNEPVYVVAQSSEKNNEIITINKNSNFIFGELKDIEAFKDKKTISFVDDDIFKRKKAFYQYGVEIKIFDASYTYFKKILDGKLLVGLNTLKDYLNNTNNKLYYNQTDDLFLDNYINNIYPIIRTALEQTINDFIQFLTQFGIVIEQNELQSIFECLNPKFATADLIQFIIQIYSNVISQVNLILQNLKNSTIELEYWFGGRDPKKSNLFDGSIDPEAGYRFYKPKLQNGFLTLQNDEIVDRTRQELELFSDGERGGDGVPIQQRYSFITPNFIRLKDNVLSTDTITAANASNDRTLEKFNRFEILIKSYKKNPEQLFKKLENNSVQNIERRKKLDISNFLEDFSIVVKNLAVEPSPLETAPAEKVLSTTVEPTNLLLGFSKYADANVNKLLSIQRTEQIFENITEAEAATLSSTDHPYHLREISLGRSPIFKIVLPSGASTTPSLLAVTGQLKYNSIYAILYGNLHSIFYYSSGTNEWKFLTSDIYRGITTGTKILCRLIKNSHATKQIPESVAVELPIYDEYFFIQK